MKNRICSCLVLAAICESQTSCVLVPDTIAPALEHQSHVTQHWGANRSEYNANEVVLVARWDLPKDFFLEASEGYNLNRYYPLQNSYGEIEGVREQFEVRAGLLFRVKGAR